MIQPWLSPFYCAGIGITRIIGLDRSATPQPLAAVSTDAQSATTSRTQW
jgi:hypothetical protein